jgi:putative intracellular protease/amidase
MNQRLIRAARILGRVAVSTAIAGGIITAVAVTGVQTSMANMRIEPTAEGDWPSPAPTVAGRVNVAVVIGATGSVVTDVLAPYEVFARSTTFHVYTVSARRIPVPLTGGLRVLPDYTLADPAAPVPDVVVVPAVVDPAGAGEAATRHWIVAQAGRGARILGVCSGSRFLAATGLLDGHRATSFWSDLGALAGDYPRVTWLSGQRYVQDGAITTTAGVTSGVVGSLRLVEQIAGRAEAERIGREVGYPHWTIDGPTAITVNHIGPQDLPRAVNFAFPWGRPTVGLGLTDGVGEIDVAAAFEIYSGTSSAADAVGLATRPLVTTQHGLVLVPVIATAQSRSVDRFVVPGLTDASQVDAGLRQWAASRDLAVDLPDRDRRPGESGFDAVLRDLAAHADRATARTTAKYIEYPVDGLSLTGAAWPWRASLLMLATVAIAIAVGIGVPLGIRRLYARMSSR